MYFARQRDGDDEAIETAMPRRSSAQRHRYRSAGFESIALQLLVSLHVSPSVFASPHVLHRLFWQTAFGAVHSDALPPGHGQCT